MLAEKDADAVAAERWGDMGDGHISARDPERTDCFWFLRFGVSYHNATVDDLVLINPEGELVADAVGLFVTLERVCEAHMKVRNPKPISPEAARFAKQDLIKYGPGRGTFYSLVKRHIPDKSVVNSKAV